MDGVTQTLKRTLSLTPHFFRYISFLKLLKSSLQRLLRLRTAFITSNLICNEPNGYYQLEMNKYLVKKDIVPNPYMKVQSIEAVKKCVMNNLGLAVVPTYPIIEELKSGSLVPVKTELDEKRYNSIYVYHC